MLELPGRRRGRFLVLRRALPCLALLFCARGALASDLPPALTAVIDGIFTPPNALHANDITAEIVRIAAATPTPSPTPTPTGTVTGTATVTLTPTLRACPAKTAIVDFDVENLALAAPAMVRLSGARMDGDCLGGSGAVSYDVTTECAAGISTCARVDGLRPGSWVHSVSVLAPATGQLQYRTSLLLAGAAANKVKARLYPQVATVTTTADTGAGSLRTILQGAGGGARPLRIQFDPLVFPPGVPTAVVFRSAPPNLAASDVTIDGIDATGAAGNRILDANGDNNAALAITGARNQLIGLRLRNAGANDRDVLSISGIQASANVVENCIVETAASADAIGVDQQAGQGFDATANVIRNTEVFGATDKGIKVTTGSYLRVEDSWVHDNLNGGIQAALGGHLQALQNVVEDNRGSTAQNGISVLGASDNGGEVSFSELETRGNISRRNGASGLAVRVGASAKVRDDFLAVNGTSGIRVFNDNGPPATADVQGTSAVCNGGDGVVIANASIADFGGGPLSSLGDNAFAQNNLPAGFENFRNVTGAEVSAVNDQWEHCGRGTTCNDEEIRRLDLNDGGLDVLIAPAQAQRNLQPLVASVSPARGSHGDLLRIYGSGFNVIDGLFAEDRCADVTGRNTCVPVRGNCVQIGGAAAPVEAVTPTLLVVRWPFTCTEPVALVVKVDQGATVVTSPPVTVCE